MTTYKTTFANGKTSKVEKRGTRFYYRSISGRMLPVAKASVYSC